MEKKKNDRGTYRRRDTAHRASRARLFARIVDPLLMLMPLLLMTIAVRSPVASTI